MDDETVLEAICDSVDLRKLIVGVLAEVTRVNIDIDDEFSSVELSDEAEQLDRAAIKIALALESGGYLARPFDFDGSLAEELRNLPCWI